MEISLATVQNDPQVMAAASRGVAPVEEETPSVFEIIGAISNASRLAPLGRDLGGEEDPKDDPRYREEVDGYDPLQHIQGYEEFASNFVNLRNPYAVAAEKRKIRRELGWRDTINRGGALGTVLEMIFSTIQDPFNLVPIPGLGASRGLFSVVKSSGIQSVRRAAVAGAARTGAEAVIATTASELVAQQQLSTRTTEESLVGIISAGLFGAGLGGIAAAGSATRFNLNARDAEMLIRSRLESEILGGETKIQRFNRAVEARGYKGRDLPDRVAREIAEEIDQQLEIEALARADSVKLTAEESLAVRSVTRLTSWLRTPTGIMARSKSGRLKAAYSLLEDHGLLIDEAVGGQPVAARHWGLNREIAYGVDQMRQGYMRFRGATSDPIGEQQFFDEVGRYLLKGELAGDLSAARKKAIEEAADVYRKTLEQSYNPAVRSSLWVNELNEEENYFPRKWWRDKVLRDEAGFISQATEALLQGHKDAGKNLAPGQAEQMARRLLKNLRDGSAGRVKTERLGIKSPFQDADLLIDWQMMDGYLILDPRTLLMDYMAKGALADALTGYQFAPHWSGSFRSLGKRLTKAKRAILDGNRGLAEDELYRVQDLHYTLQMVKNGVDADGKRLPLADLLERARQIERFADDRFQASRKLRELRSKRAQYEYAEDLLARIEAFKRGEGGVPVLDGPRIEGEAGPGLDELEAHVRDYLGSAENVPSAEALRDAFDRVERLEGILADFRSRVAKKGAPRTGSREASVRSDRLGPSREALGELESPEQAWEVLRGNANAALQDMAYTGSTMQAVLDDIRLDLESRGVSEKRIQNEIGAVETVLHDIRGSEIVPADPDSVAFRAMKGLRAYSAMRWLGGIVPSSIADTVIPILQSSVGEWFRSYARGTFQTMRGIPRARLAELERAAERTLSSRAHRLNFFAEGQPRDWIDTASDQFFNATGINHWNAFHRGVATYSSQSILLKAIDAKKTGKGFTKRYQDVLKQSRLRNSDIDRIHEQWLKHGEKDGSLWVSNEEVWDDVAGVQEAGANFRSAVLSEVNRMNLLPNSGDIPRAQLKGQKPWAGENALRLLLQFRSYGLTATNKILLSGLQRMDASVAIGYTAMIAGGIMVEMMKRGIREGSLNVADAIGTAPERREEEDLAWNELFFAGVDRSGILGIVMDLSNTIDRAAPFRSPISAAFGKTRDWAPQGFFDALAGPALGGVTDLMKGATALADGEENTAAQNKLLRSLVPYNNVFYFRGIFDAIEGSFGGRGATSSYQPIELGRSF